MTGRAACRERHPLPLPVEASTRPISHVSCWAPPISDFDYRRCIAAIAAAIKQGKLVTSKSKNFENVLRRTLSTSTVVKRVARATYGE